MLKLIRAYLEAGVVADGIVHTREVGTPLYEQLGGTALDDSQFASLSADQRATPGPGQNKDERRAQLPGALARRDRVVGADSLSALLLKVRSYPVRHRPESGVRRADRGISATRPRRQLPFATMGAS